MLVLEAEATVAQLDLLNDISKRSRCCGKQSQLRAGGRPLQGQELSELPFSVPSPPTPRKRGSRALRGRGLCTASCLLSGFEKRKKVAEKNLSPLRAHGKVAFKRQFPGNRRRGAAALAADNQERNHLYCF